MDIDESREKPSKKEIGFLVFFPVWLRLVNDAEQISLPGGYPVSIWCLYTSEIDLN